MNDGYLYTVKLKNQNLCFLPLLSRWRLPWSHSDSPLFTFLIYPSSYSTVKGTLHILAIHVLSKEHAPSYLGHLDYFVCAHITRSFITLVQLRYLTSCPPTRHFFLLLSSSVFSFWVLPSPVHPSLPLEQLSCWSMSHHPSLLLQIASKIPPAP